METLRAVGDAGHDLQLALPDPLRPEIVGGVTRQTCDVVHTPNAVLGTRFASLTLRFVVLSLLAALATGGGHHTHAIVQSGPRVAGRALFSSLPHTLSTGVVTGPTLEGTAVKILSLPAGFGYDASTVVAAYELRVTSGAVFVSRTTAICAGMVTGHARSVHGEERGGFALRRAFAG